MQDTVGENQRATPRTQDEAAKAGAQRTEGTATAPVETGAGARPNGGESTEGAHPAGDLTGGPGGRGPSESTERTPAGQQHVLPGAERAPDAELAQRRADERLKPKVAQRPAGFGLFSDESKQTDYFRGGNQ